MIHYPCLKIFGLNSMGELTSLHAQAPWAKRTYKRGKWNHDKRGIWVYPLTPSGIHTTALSLHISSDPWEVWFCLASRPFHPKDALEALLETGKEPDWDSLEPLITELAVKKLKPALLITSHDRVKNHSVDAIQSFFWENLQWVFRRNHHYV